MSVLISAIVGPTVPIPPRRSSCTGRNTPHLTAGGYLAGARTARAQDPARRARRLWPSLRQLRRVLAVGSWGQIPVVPCIAALAEVTYRVAVASRIADAGRFRMWTSPVALVGCPRYALGLVVDEPNRNVGQFGGAC